MLIHGFATRIRHSRVIVGFVAMVLFAGTIPVANALQLSNARNGGGSAGQSSADEQQPASKQEPSSEAEKAERLKALTSQVEALKKELDTLRARPETPQAAKDAAAPPKTESVASPASNEAPPPAAESTASSAPASERATPVTFKPEWLQAMSWRCIGPAAMGGRVVQIAAVDGDPCCYFVATASGGLFKTTNYGTTFTPIFDHQASISIGDFAIAPSNPQVLWVGTGEHNARNSVSWGDGVYKSTDGGKSWENMGLRESYQIGRIAIHPRNPDIIYVGALGRLWGENEQRGVFKTIDGGRSWERVLYVDAKTGCIDLVLDPNDPETVIAAMYERQRGIYDDGDPIKRWGPGSGLYKSVNGGKNWTRLTQGLPSVAIGRIGLSVYKKDSKVVYAVIETEKIATGPQAPGSDRPSGYLGIQGEGEESGAKLTNVTPGGPADLAGLRDGDVVIELGGKAVTSYADLTSLLQTYKSGDKVGVKIQRELATTDLEVTFGERPAGAGTRGNATANAYSSGLGGQRENMQDRQGQDGFQTGGVYRSNDGGDSWTRVNSLNPRPFYFSRIYVDPNDDNNLYVLGVSSYRSSDGGKTFRADLARGVHSDHHALWIDPRDGRRFLLGGDGGLYGSNDRGASWEHVNIMPLGQFYHVAVDTRRPYRIYGGLQDNGSWGGPSMTRGRGPTNEDWITVGGGDGFTCQVDQNDPDLVYYTSQYGSMGRINVRTGERRSIRPQPERNQRFRFNWKTPFVLSNHNSKIFYAAGNYVFKSLDRGDKIRTISPEITATNRGTASALAESPLNPDVLYVGTDDGALWVSRDGGHDWTNITENVRDMPSRSCVASIEPSRYKDSRCYIAIDAHRVDSTAPLLYVSDDFGKTWSSLRANLPDGAARTLREDIQNENLLYVGTEFGAWVSLDRGAAWLQINNNLPTVAVHDFAQPRTANELVAATHGRSIWILDITPLRQLSNESLASSGFLFRPATAVTWGNPVSRTLSGHKRYTGENPPDGTVVHYLLPSGASDVKLRVVDADGATVRELAARNTAGLHRVVWDLRRGSARGQRPDASGADNATTQARSGAARAGQAAQAQNRGGQAAARVSAGQYRLVLTVDGKELTQPLVVESDPQFVNSTIAEEDDDDEDVWY